MDRSSSKRCCTTLLLAALIAIITGATGCTGSLPFLRSSPPTPTGESSAVVSPDATVVADDQPVELPALPEMFRFEVSMQTIGTAEGTTTISRGQYREGDWSREARRTDASQSTDNGSTPSTLTVEELIVTDGSSYSRPSADFAWTLVSGMSFEAAYGLTSPFTVLRLFSEPDPASQKALEQVPGAPVATFRQGIVFTEAAVRRILDAGINRLTSDATQRALLSEQVAPLAVSQTITYWVGEDGYVYRAAATLLAADGSGLPAPWLQIVWRFWDYGDQTIAVPSPDEYRDASEPAAIPLPEPTAESLQPSTEKNLVVNVFASAGVPAENLAVTIYPAGDESRPLEWRNTAIAEFSLPSGAYDALVQMDYAQEWIRDIRVNSTEVEARDVTFDFGTLELTITRDGEIIPVEVVTYPAGDRQDWVDWRSDNPATIRLRAGTYDVEIAYNDYTATQTVTELVIQAGETTSQAVSLEP